MKGVVIEIWKIPIQTDASINRGNRGGAIMNNNGLVQGVVSSKLTGFGIEGVAFGIPGYEIFERLKIQIADNEKVTSSMD